jgi:hypothetical protein
MNRRGFLQAVAVGAVVAPMVKLEAVAEGVANLLQPELVFEIAPETGALIGSHTMTELIPSIYAALDIVSRELVGFMPTLPLNDSGPLHEYVPIYENQHVQYRDGKLWIEDNDDE